MKVYIAGKITGDPDYRAKFKRAEDRLKEEGYTVINPAVLPAGLDPADYGRICFAMLDSADAVAFLGDFGESQGAKLEFEYCKYAKKKIIHLHEEDERAVTFWAPTPKPGLYKRIIQTNISKPDGGKPKPEYLKKVIEEAQKEMDAKCRKEVIDQLKSLLAHCKTMRELGAGLLGAGRRHRRSPRPHAGAGGRVLGSMWEVDVRKLEALKDGSTD